MTTLRQAVQEYVRMRRDLGFKLRDAGKALLDFIRFMEQRRASYIRLWKVDAAFATGSPTPAVHLTGVPHKPPHASSTCPVVFRYGLLLARSVPSAGRTGFRFASACAGCSRRPAALHLVVDDDYGFRLAGVVNR
jgi:hypothetical protein